MTPDYAGLKAEDALPKYASMPDADRVAAINAAGSPVPAPGSFLAEGGILRVLNPTNGDAFLSTVETASEVPGNPLGSLLKRNIRIIRDTSGGGIDFGQSITWGVLDQLAASIPAIASACSALKTYGSRPGPSIANTLGFPWITTADLAEARKR